MEDTNELPPPAKTTFPYFWIVLLLIVGAVLYMSTYARRTADVAGTSSALPGVGTPLPYAYFEPLTGAQRPVQTDDLKNKVVLINYWGPWCQFCAQEFPELVALERKYHNNPQFLFISVSSDGTPDNLPGDLAEQTTEFLTRYNATFPTYVDRGGRNRSYLVTITRQKGFGYPFTVLVNRSGNIAGIWPGYDKAYARQMQIAVEQALAAPPATAAAP